MVLHPLGFPQEFPKRSSILNMNCWEILGDLSCFHVFGNLKMSTFYLQAMSSKRQFCLSLVFSFLFLFGHHLANSLPLPRSIIIQAFLFSVLFKTVLFNILPPLRILFVYSPIQQILMLWTERSGELDSNSISLHCVTSDVVANEWKSFLWPIRLELVWLAAILGSERRDIFGLPWYV